MPKDKLPENLLLCKSTIVCFYTQRLLMRNGKNVLRSSNIFFWSNYRHGTLTSSWRPNWYAVCCSYAVPVVLSADTHEICCTSPCLSPRRYTCLAWRYESAYRRAATWSFLVCQFLEVGKKIAFHLLLVEEIVTIVDDSLEATAAYRLGSCRKVEVILLFRLVLRLGIDVDAKRLMADNLHRALVTIRQNKSSANSPR